MGRAASHSGRSAGLHPQRTRARGAPVVLASDDQRVSAGCDRPGTRTSRSTFHFSAPRLLKQRLSIELDAGGAKGGHEGTPARRGLQSELVLEGRAQRAAQGGDQRSLARRPQPLRTVAREEEGKARIGRDAADRPCREERHRDDDDRERCPAGQASASFIHRDRARVAGGQAASLRRYTHAAEDLHQARLNTGETDLLRGRGSRKDHTGRGVRRGGRAHTRRSACARRKPGMRTASAARRLQGWMFDLGAYLASHDAARRAKCRVPEPRESDVAELEKAIDAFESESRAAGALHLPGGTPRRPPSTWPHRVPARRALRRWRSTTRSRWMAPLLRR